MLDNGPQFTAAEFRLFTEKWGINHITSSPHHPGANGKAESAAKVIKHLILKCQREDQCQFEAPMEQRNTPRQDTGYSPNEMMFGRQTRTMIPALNRTVKHDSRRERRKKSVKKYYDKRAQDLPFLHIGQNVYFEHKPGEKWILGKVKKTLGDYTCKVISQNGAT